jgi:hypothetical protein
MFSSSLSFVICSIISWLCLKAVTFSFLMSRDHPIPIFPVSLRFFSSLESKGHAVGSGYFELGFIGACLLIWTLVKNKTSFTGGFRRTLVVLSLLSFVNQACLATRALKNPSYIFQEVSRYLNTATQKGEGILGYGSAGVMWDAKFYAYEFIPCEGIGYRGKTNAELDTVIEKHSVRFLILLIPAKILSNSGEFDWSIYDNNGCNQDKIRVKSPALLKFKRVVMSWPTLLNPGYGDLRWVLLQRV